MPNAEFPKKFDHKFLSAHSPFRIPNSTFCIHTFPSRRDRSSSARVTVAVPRLPTTTPAA